MGASYYNYIKIIYSIYSVKYEAPPPSHLNCCNILNNKLIQRGCDRKKYTKYYQNLFEAGNFSQYIFDSSDMFLTCKIGDLLVLKIWSSFTEG